MKKNIKSLLLAFSLLVSLQVIANDGALDITFGGGLVTTGAGAGIFAPFVPTAYGVAIQTDGKVVATGQDANANFQTVRYNADGSLDSSFGTGGIVSIGTGFATALALQPDGKIVAVGQDQAGPFFAASGPKRAAKRKNLQVKKASAPQPPKFEVVRYNSNGSLDTTFAGTGIVKPSLGFAQGVALQKDNKIVSAGIINTSTGTSFWGVVRLTPEGVLDTSFGGTGIVTTGPGLIPGPGQGAPTAQSVQIQPDGKIVVTGTLFDTASGNFFFAVARYNTDGSLDSSFGTAGITLLGAGGSPAGLLPTGFWLLIQPDGKILAIGYSANETYQLFRLTSSGALDSSFGTGGSATPLGQGFGIGGALQSDGKIVVTLELFDQTKQTFFFALTRYNSDGTLDTTFGTNGIVEQNDPDPEGTVSANSAALQSDGKIIASGITVQNPPNLVFWSVGRYLVANTPLAETVITSPTTGSVVSNGTPFSGTCQNPAIVTLFFTNTVTHAVTEFATTVGASGSWTITPTGLANGTYNVVAIANYKDGNVLLASLPITVEVGEVTLTVSPDPICNGQEATLTLTVPVPPTESFSVDWSDGVTQPNVFSPDKRIVSPDKTTVYSAIIRLHTGQTLISPSVTLTVNEDPTISIRAKPNPICFGTQTKVRLTASLTGKPPFRVTWSDGFSQEVNSFTAVHNVVLCKSHTFSATVVDADGCKSNEASVSIFATEKACGKQSPLMRAIRKKYCGHCKETI